LKERCEKPLTCFLSSEIVNTHTENRTTKQNKL
jgi:hypothetical protein